LIEIPIPGRSPLRLEHLVLDLNGTLAIDGEPIEGVLDRLRDLADRLAIRIVTADTRGVAAERTAGWPVELAILDPGRQDEAKRAVVEELGAESVAAVGNGLNDRLLLEAAALGIAVVQAEGAAGATLAAAAVVAPDIRAALDLLRFPTRLVATLRT
jgi:soluble P-type ATPase